MRPDISGVQDYVYHLPPERIAGFPLPHRDESRLLVWKDLMISETIFRNISSLIPQNALVVFNDTRVVEARLLFQKPTGGEIEIFCLEPHEQYGDITSAMMQTRKGLVEMPGRRRIQMEIRAGIEKRHFAEQLPVKPNRNLH